MRELEEVVTLDNGRRIAWSPDERYGNKIERHIWY